MASWLAVERWTQGPTHPRYAEMLKAAHAMQSASRLLWTEKRDRGLLPPAEADPNRTGMIGAEFSDITTTIGNPEAKRTTTSPDFAAALLKLITTLDLPAGTPVVIVVSGSFVGGNIATIAAVEALGLRPVVVASLSASQWGATDPDFNLLDIFHLLRQHGVIRTETAVTVLGGEGAVAGGMNPEAVEKLRASADRDHVPVVEVEPLAAMIDVLLDHVHETLGEAARPGLVINVGGAVIGLGSCRESYEFPPGLTKRPVSCSDGTPGLAMRLAEDGTPVLHVLNIRRLALEMGLPFDPVPLPMPGDNVAIYGRSRGDAH